MPALARLERIGRIERYPTQVERRAGGGLAAERHYLPFPGTTSIGFIDGGATGYSTAYAVVTKWANLPATPSGPVNLSNSALAFSRNLVDSTQLEAAAPNQQRHVGLTSGGAVNYNRASGGTGQCPGAQVQMMGRDNAGNLARVRVVKASDQAVFWAPADAATSEDSTPDDIAIGGYPNPNGSLNSDSSNVWLVAVVFLDAVPADALLQAYAAPTCRDARLVFGSSIKGYWVASGAVGSSIPALVGTAPMALTGVTASALVSL